MPTLETLSFYSWWRDAVHGGSVTPTGARLSKSIPVTLQQRGPSGDVQASESRALSLTLAGPLDVTSLAPGAITRRYPVPATTNAEETKFAHVELADHRLPWRYTMLPTPGSGEPLVPWLVLVVARADDEVSLTADRVVLSHNALVAHDLDESHSWAHVQEHDGRKLARILSPRRLDADTSYVAVLVPAFVASDAGSAAAWTPETETVELPAYASWRFRTGKDGDFLSLSRALSPRPIAAADAVASIAYPRVPAAGVLQARGALSAPASADASLPAGVADDLGSLLLPRRDERGRPVVGLPRYGAPWVADPTTTAWGATLNTDPRHRIAAGLGRRFAVKAQQRLTDLAIENLGALSVAEQRVRFLALGIDAARSLWRRRLPAGDEAQLQLFGPALARLMTPTGAVLDRATAQDRPLASALFSSAARRVLRGGPARSRMAEPGARAPSRVLREANKCPTPPKPGLGLPHLGNPKLGQEDVDTKLRSLAGADRSAALDAIGSLLRKVEPVREPNDIRMIAKWVADNLCDKDLPLAPLLWLVAVSAIEEKWSRALDELWHELFKVVRLCFKRQDDKPKVSELVKCLRERDKLEGGDLAHATELIDQLLSLFRPVEERPCRPVDLAALADGVRRAFDPTIDVPRAAERVYGTLGGVAPDRRMAPVEACPGLELPVWELLRDHGPEWLLPGLGRLQEHAVAAVETSASFVDALMVGVNQQLVGELAWRSIPIGRGCTPLRHFWGRRSAETGEPLADIRGVRGWSSDSALGGAAHRADPSAGPDLVILFRSALFHRYPTTVIYLHPASGGATPDWASPPGEARAIERDVYPMFHGRMGEDVAFFGFGGLSAEDAARMWLILEEPPSGYSFREPEGVMPTASSAALASSTLASPVRVVIRGDSLVART